MRWFGGSKRQRVRRAPDFADHGTAFGLDLSLTADMAATAALNAKLSSGIAALGAAAGSGNTAETAHPGR
jgi:hypothetical protein